MSTPARPAQRTLILGIGNRIMHDDAVGVIAAERIGRDVDADVLTGPATGLVLLDCLAGYDRAVIVDATCTGCDAPGTVRHRDVDAMRSRAATYGPHTVGVEGMLAWARTSGLELPERIDIYTVEAERLWGVGERLSPAVAAALPQVIQRIKREQFSLDPHETGK